MTGTVSSTKFTIKTVFADESTGTINIEDINPESVTSQLIESARQKIIAFNNSSGGALSTKMKSKNGFNWIGIKSFTISTTTRNYIF